MWSVAHRQCFSLPEARIVCKYSKAHTYRLAPSASLHSRVQEYRQDFCQGRLSCAVATGLAILISAGQVYAEAAADSSSYNTGIVAANTTILQEQNESALRTKPQDAPPAEVFLILKSTDISGKIIVNLFRDTPVGASRFANLAKGGRGVGYQRSQIDGVAKGLVSSSGVHSLNYSSSDDSDYVTLDALQAELQQTKHVHDQPGIVSLIVRDSKPRVIKEKLVAYNGKFITVKEPQGEGPNGTAFTITLEGAPELDASQLPIGQVVEGMDLVKKVAALPHVESKAGSPFFKIAKIVGDKRADVAEKGFGRPYQKVVIVDCGIES